MSAPRSPSGDSEGRDRARIWLIALVALILGIRLMLAGALHLTEDEAYYRLWSQKPALGYFDHPPMIAWWIWLGRQVGGDTPLGVRLLPCLSAALISFLVFDLARSLGAGRTSALRAAVWYNSTLLIAAGGFLAVPDAPAALFWVACLSAVARTMRATSGLASRGWWILAGVAAGLGALSKYSALFLGPGIFLWLITRADGRRTLMTLGPWLALASAGAIFSLNIDWNAQHHWLTFAKQFGRIAPHRFAPTDLADLLVSQFVLLNPLIAIFVVRGLTHHRSAVWEKVAFLAVSSLPFAAYLGLHALHDRVQAHWPAPLYAPLAMIAAIAASHEMARSGWSKLRSATPFVGLGACSLALLLLLLPEIGVPLSLDPAKPVRGWPAFAMAVDEARARAGAAWVGTTSYGVAAQLLDQPQIPAPVLQINERDRWSGLAPSRADLTQPGLIIDLTRRIQLSALHRCFGQVTALGVIGRGAQSEIATPYAAVRVANPLRNVISSGC